MSKAEGAQWWCYVPSKTLNCSHCFQLRDCGPGLTKEQMQTMKELDYVEKKEKLPIGPCRSRQGLLHLVMYLEAIKWIAIVRVVCCCELRRSGEMCTVDASATGFRRSGKIELYVLLIASGTDGMIL